MVYKSKNKIPVMNIDNPQKETIKKIIKDKNLNYRNIAKVLNISLSKLHRIIKQNRFNGDFVLKEKLSVILNVDVNYIFPVIEITTAEKKELQEYYKRIDKYYFRRIKQCK